jgi:hypothetical protein
VHCDFDKDIARFSFSVNDGRAFQEIGGDFPLPFQLKTFQGVRYALFHYNGGGSAGGYADFDSFHVDEPRPRGLTKPVPYGRWIAFSSLANGSALSVENAAGFQVIDRGLGRVALRSADGKYLSAGPAGELRMAQAKPAMAETFQWVDLQRGDTLLLSVVTHRYLIVPPAGGPATADHPGPAPDRKDGTCFRWRVVR